MAKPREPAKPDPPAESEEEEEESGEEEEEEEGSSESESEPEPEPEPTQKKASSAPVPAPKKPEPSTPKAQPTAAAAAAASSSSSSEDESGSDSDAEAPAQKPDPNIKPLASKPMEDQQKTTPTTKKPRSKLNLSGPTSPTKPTSGAGAKRPAVAGGDEGKDSKKSKKKTESEAESSEKKGNSIDDSRKLFQRLWSEDDEIAILKGMLDYSAKKNADPVADLNDFLEFIKKNLHIDVTRSQLQNKIRRLKKKYENNAVKEKKGNKERTFSQAHEQKAYDLSKKIWGSEKNGGVEEAIESSKVNGTAVKKSRSRSVVGSSSKIDGVEEKMKEVKDLVSEKNVVEGLKNVSFGADSLRIEEWVHKHGTELIKDGKKRAELEEKWSELKVKEIELLARRSELIAEQSRLILEGLKSSGH